MRLLVVSLRSVALSVALLLAYTGIRFASRRRFRDETARVGLKAALLCVDTQACPSDVEDDGDGAYAEQNLRPSLASSLPTREKGETHLFRRLLALDHGKEASDCLHQLSRLLRSSGSLPTDSNALIASSFSFISLWFLSSSSPSLLASSTQDAVDEVLLHPRR